jgi:DNA topoisomerase-3
MTIILTEKPSVAASFAGALCVPKKDKIYVNDSYCIVNALGHLLKTYEPQDYDVKYAAWRLEDLPIIPERFLFKEIPGTADQLKIIKTCFDNHKGADLLLATDAEREGELIGAEILEYVGFRNYGSAKRFWVSEALTKEVVLKGMENAKPLSEYAAYKEQGYARQQADWLVGMNLSRFVTKSCEGRTFHIGRVKSAVLAAVYEREKSIAGFAKEKYLEMIAVMANGSFSVRLTNPGNEKFPARFPESSPLVKDAAGKIKTPTTGKVTAVEKKETAKGPPPLFNLTALQKEASRLFSYAPEHTLDIAQALYEKHKCQSYPRTPSRVLGDDDVDLVKSVFEKIKAAYPEKISDDIDAGLISQDNKRLFDSSKLQDHHALIPLAPIPEGAGQEEKNIYNLVLDRFLTSLKPDYIYNSVRIKVDISGFSFHGSGVEVLQLGWRKDLINNEDEGGDEQILSGVEEKEYPVNSVKVEEKFTKPKKLFTYATILQLMENPRNEEGAHLVGLGTPATRGSILKDLFDKNYLSLEKKNILSTSDGKFLVETLQKNDELKKVCSIPQTTEWEEQLHRNCAEFVRGIEAYVRSALGTKIESRYQRESVGKCPVCGKPVVEGKLSFSCAGWKEGCNFTVWKDIKITQIQSVDVVALLARQKTKVKKCKSKAGKEFTARLFLKDDNTIGLEFENEKNEPKKKGK